MLKYSIKEENGEMKIESRDESIFVIVVFIAAVAIGGFFFRLALDRGFPIEQALLISALVVLGTISAVDILLSLIIKALVLIRKLRFRN